MRRPSPCPEPQILRRLALGELPAAALEAVADHVEQCGHCAAVLAALPAEDVLIDAVRNQASAAPPARDGPVDALIGRLIGLHSAAPGPPAGSTSDTEPYPFLAPAQGPGEIGVLGAYRVCGLLGAGGMGIVFRAEDIRGGREVALKVLRAALAADESARRRFRREAEATAAIRSDHIVTIYEVGEERGTPFLAMELLEGLPLNRLLRGGRLPLLPQVLRLGRETAEALAAAHAQGLIHRDVKPANIWIEVSRGARVKLLDFGLALPLADRVRLTGRGVLVGTPEYMAPEQAQGRDLDARADLFSLGCVLYRLCTGKNPFGGPTPADVVRALSTADARPVRDLNPEVPPALADLVTRLLSRDPAGRPASARQVIEELQAVERSLPRSTPALGPAAPAAVPAAAPPPKVVGRRRWLLAAALALLLLASLACGVALRYRPGRPGPPTSAPHGRAHPSREAPPR